MFHELVGQAHCERSNDMVNVEVVHVSIRLHHHAAVAHECLVRPGQITSLYSYTVTYTAA